jgi:hypothetical protein
MPRAYNLADVFDVLNTESGIAMSPDTTDLVDAEQNNQLVNPLETPVGSDGGLSGTFTGTPFVVLAASSIQWDVGQWGRLQWG